MKKIKAEIRTEYSIELTGNDFINVAEGAHGFLIENEHFKAFSRSATAGELFDFWKSFPLTGTSNDFKAIAYHFGFSGWTNAGYYNDDKAVYCMGVYNNGADDI